MPSPRERQINAWAARLGRNTARVVQQTEQWRQEGREWARLGLQFWRQVQEPRGRQRHVGSLLALALAAGLVAGWITSRRHF